MARKKQIFDRKKPQDEVNKSKSILAPSLQVLQMLPGVTVNDLQKWNDEEFHADDYFEIPFDKLLSAQNQTNTFAVEQCRILKIDPTLPTDERPNSDTKRIIQMARQELEIPLYVSGDRKEDDPDPLPKQEIELEPDEWEDEDEIEAAFYRSKRSLTPEEILKNSIDALVNS